MHSRASRLAQTLQFLRDCESVIQSMGFINKETHRARPCLLHKPPSLLSGNLKWSLVSEEFIWLDSCPLFHSFPHTLGKRIPFHH